MWWFFKNGVGVSMCDLCPVVISITIVLKVLEQSHGRVEAKCVACHGPFAEAFFDMSYSLNS